MKKKLIAGFVIGFIVTVLTGSPLLAIVIAMIAGLFMGNK